MMIASILFQGILLVSKPFSTTNDNRIAIFNEVCVSIYLYFSYLLTDWTVEPAIKPIIGDILGSFISIVLLVNLVRGLYRVYQYAKKIYFNRIKRAQKEVAVTKTVSIQPMPNNSESITMVTSFIDDSLVEKSYYQHKETAIKGKVIKIEDSFTHQIN